MSMTLSGNGTITGLVSGGLPDGTVLPADLSTGGPYWDTSGNFGLGATTAAAGGSIKQVISGATRNGLQLTNNNNGGFAVVPLSGGGAYFYTHTGAVGSETYSNERLIIDSSGNLLVGKTSATANGGDVQVSKGITFPATQVACSDANTLDDYEEGTFTPTLTFGGGSTGITYIAQAATYIKIGRLVYIRFGMYLSSKGSSTGIVRIDGLPFVCFSQGYSDSSGMFNGINLVSLSSGITGIPANGSSSVYLYTMTSTGSTALTNSNFSNTSEFYGGLCYVTTA